MRYSLRTGGNSETLLSVRRHRLSFVVVTFRSRAFLFIQSVLFGGWGTLFCSAPRVPFSRGIPLLNICNVCWGYSPFTLVFLSNSLLFPRPYLFPLYALGEALFALDEGFVCACRELRRA